MVSSEELPPYESRKEIVVPVEDEDYADEHTSLSIHKSNPDKPKIPDGGWGWMIVTSSLFISLIQDGISFSFGVLFIEFTEEFNASKASASWVGCLFVSVPLITGPMMSALVDRYGCRPMTMLGGLVSAAGFILSYWAQSIVVMYITFGIVSGLGLGLTYITAVVSIAFWFDKKRNLAVGLGACGTGIGTILYAPFTNYLVEQFGWRWSLILLAGTLLNMCVCGAVMRDPDWIIEQNKLSSKSSSLSNISTHSEKISLEAVRDLLKSGKDGEYILQTLATSVDREDKVSKSDHHSSQLNLPTFIKQNERVPVEVLEHLQQNKKLYRVILQNYPSLLHCRSTSEKGLNKIVEDSSLMSRIPVTFSLKLKKTDNKPKPVLTTQYSLTQNPAAEPLMAPEKKPRVIKPDNTPWLVKQISGTNHPQNYFKNMRFPRNSLIHRGAILNKNKYKLRASSCPNIYKVSMTSLTKDDDEPWYSAVTSLFELFYEFHYLLMSLSTVMLFACFMTPYFYLVDHMLALGYPESEAALVLSVIGIANTIGMVGFGWLGDQNWTSVPKMYGAACILCGGCCSLMYELSTSYILLNIVSFFYGIFLASSFAFTPTLLMELLPLETFTKAYGLQLMCQGLGHLFGPPLAAYIADVSLTWTYTFHVSSVCIALSGVCILVIPYTKNRKLIGSGPTEKEKELNGSMAASDN